MLDNEMHFALMRAYNASNQEIAPRVRALGLLPGQPKVLEYLWEHGEAIARDICAGCSLDKSTMASLLARMESGGLIVRRVSDRDRRVQLVSLTQRGSECAKQVKETMSDVNELMLKGISDGDRDCALRVLAQIVGNLEEGR